MPTLDLTPAQRDALGDYGLPIAMSTEKGVVRWQGWMDRIAEARLTAEPADAETLAGVLDAMDRMGEVFADEDEHTREVTEAIAAKMRAACAVMQEADFMNLAPGTDEGAPADEYDLEAAIIAGVLPSGADQALAAQTVAYVLSRCFGVEVGEDEAEPIAAKLLAAMPDDSLDPSDFPWPVIKELVDRTLADY